jgi:hypothetical protein
MNQTVNQAEQALARFAPLDGEDVAMTRVDFPYPEPEEVLTCPGYPNEIRWQPGERLNHLFEKRFPLLRENGGGGHMAIIAEDGELSYDDLEHESNRLAVYLIEGGVRPGDRIGLLFSRSIWAYVAMLAVMKANAAYVPLDAGFPKDRIAFIAEDAGIRLFLTTASLRGHLDSMPREVVCLDRQQSGNNRQMRRTRQQAPPRMTCATSSILRARLANPRVWRSSIPASATSSGPRPRSTAFHRTTASIRA